MKRKAKDEAFEVEMAKLRSETDALMFTAMQAEAELLGGIGDRTRDAEDARIRLGKVVGLLAEEVGKAEAAIEKWEERNRIPADMARGRLMLAHRALALALGFAPHTENEDEAKTNPIKAPDKAEAER